MTSSAQNSKQFLSQKGSASTPSFSFLGGNTSGLYLSQANEVSISLGGSQKWVIGTNYLQSDFSNATIASRSAFQTITTNGNTSIGALPNGTATQAAFVAFNNSTPTNASYAQIVATSSYIGFASGAAGSGTYLPLSLFTNNIEQFRIGTSGQWGIGGPTYGTAGQAFLSGGNSAAPTWGTLGIAAGGTGQVTASAAFNALSPITATGDIIIGNGTNSATNLPIGSNGYVLTSNGTTASWQPSSFAGYTFTGTGTVIALQTAPTFLTSITSPAIYGGTTASSTLTIQSTTGTGTSDSIVFKTGSAATAVTINTSGQVNLGTVAIGNTNFLSGRNMTGGVSAYGVYSVSTVQSDVTTQANGFATSLSTAASAFTLTGLVHYYSVQTTIGLGSQITNQYGFYAQSSMRGATNNYGFFTNLTSGTTATISNVALTSNVVTITTSSAHGFGIGQTVIVAATTTTSVNGTFTITSIPSTTTFTYALVLADIPSTADTGTVYQYAGKWAFYSSSSAASSFGGSLTIGNVANTTGAAVTTTGSAAAKFVVGTATYTDIVSSGTVANGPIALIGATTLAARNTVTYTNAHSLYIGNAPSAGTNVTITNPWALYIAAGNSYFGGLVGIKSTPTAGSNMTVGGSITGATTAYNIYLGGQAQSDVTANAVGISSTTYLAASVTTSSITHFQANPFTGGSGSTATTQIGFYATSAVATAGAATVTNAYGFRGQLALAANVWNLYMDGSANNYLAGYTTTKQALSSVAVSSIGTGTTATLTAAQLLSGYITGAPTGTATYTLPLASAVDTELANGGTNWAWEFTLATTAAFSITIATATGWTLVGSMATGSSANSVARFRAVKTGSATYTLYRIS